jgi:hypothetical protein
MFGSQVLEVAVGLAVLYLLLSLICSGLNEWIAGIFALRARTLTKAITNLLQEPEMTEKLYAHPLIYGLAPGNNKPSYIPARTFSLALLDIMSVRPENLEKVRQELAQSPSQLSKTIQLLLEENNYDLQQTKKKIEDWYDQAMERVSGWYKRRSQIIILVLALAASVIFNADSLIVAQSLWQDTALRASVTAMAQEIARTAPVKDESDLAREKEIQAQLDRLQLPLGWRWNSDKSLSVIGPWGIMAKVLGLLFTTLAVSLGAPFWFDLLNKFINLRASGKLPAENGSDKVKL